MEGMKISVSAGVCRLSNGTIHVQRVLVNHSSLLSIRDGGGVNGEGAGVDMGRE